MDVLGNFANINNALHIHEGERQRTNLITKTLIVDAKLPEKFPIEFGIYDMSQFLGVLSLFEEPNLDFDNKVITIHEAKKKATYRCCDVALVKKNKFPFEQDFSLSSVDISFDLSKEMWRQVTSATRVLGLDHIAVIGNGETISVSSLNVTDPDNHQISFEVGETNKEFKLIYNIDSLKILPHNYKVNISKSKFTKFISQDMNLEYTCPCEKGSVYNG
jgi:hypothetical protein